jgi:peptidoglycan hydrolase CwlO-like protein
MASSSPDTHTARPRSRAAVASALLLGAISALAWSTSAPAQDLGATLEEKQAELRRVEGRQESLAATIERQNAEVDAVLGEVAALRSQESAVEAELAAKEAELARTEDALAGQRRRLTELRARLRRALSVLSKRVVAIYRNGQPDTLGVVLGSGDWSEALTTSEYLSRIADHDEMVAGRVADLRDETREAVRALAAQRRRIAAARDEIAARERELADARASVQARYSELNALKAEREATLAALSARGEELEGDLATLAERVAAERSAAPSTETAPLPAPAPGSTATLLPDGRAVPPAGAPPAVAAAIEAANAISDAPYLWGGGHGSFESAGYDCSGAVSYALNGGGFLGSPLDSTGLAFWGEPGPGSWITVYANSGHVYAVIAGLRWDTSGGAGPRWHADPRSTAGFVARHPAGY